MSHPHVRLEQGDWFHLPGEYISRFDGIISLQTLSWLADYKQPIECLCALKPKWIAMTSLFYEGRINYYIRLDDQEKEPHSGWGAHGEIYYNIYSIPLVKELFFKCGYREFQYMKFEIDIDLQKPVHNDMGTYTIKTEDEKRLQVSGALLMPWYFILAKR